MAHHSAKYTKVTKTSVPHRALAPPDRYNSCWCHIFDYLCPCLPYMPVAPLSCAIKKRRRQSVVMERPVVNAFHHFDLGTYLLILSSQRHGINSIMDGSSTCCIERKTPLIVDSAISVHYNKKKLHLIRFCLLFNF